MTKAEKTQNTNKLVKLLREAVETQTKENFMDDDLSGITVNVSSTEDVLKIVDALTPKAAPPGYVLITKEDWLHLCDMAHIATAIHSLCIGKNGRIQSETHSINEEGNFDEMVAKLDDGQIVDNPYSFEDED